MLAAIDATGLPAPTLVLWGANDKSAPVPQAYALYDRIRAKTPIASLHVANHSGHYIFREQAQEFARVFEAFCLQRE